MKILVLNGPNLDLLGQREPDVYGTDALADVERMMRDRAAEAGFELEFMQSNHEGTLIDFLNSRSRGADAAIINPGAFTHYSFGLRDSLAAFGKPVIEVHISNIYAREGWRSNSVTGAAVRGVISGLGIQGYLLALEFLMGSRV